MRSLLNNEDRLSKQYFNIKDKNKEIFFSVNKIVKSVVDKVNFEH